MKLQLVTLTGTKLDQEAYEVIIPTEDGEIAVFPNHEPLVTLAKPGAIQVRHAKNDADNKMEVFAIGGGVVRIDGETIQVLVDEADHSADIAEAEAKEALERAKKMQADAKNQVELEKASALVDRHAVRLKVADLHRRRRR